MPSGAWFAGIAITLVVEAFVIWRIGRAVSRGTVRVNPVFWLTDFGGFDFTANRSTNPIFFWFGILALMLLGLVVAAIFVLIAVNR